MKAEKPEGPFTRVGGMLKLLERAVNPVREPPNTSLSVDMNNLLCQLVTISKKACRDFSIEIEKFYLQYGRLTLKKPTIFRPGLDVRRRAFYALL
jgi:hypothetical protein